MTFFEPESWHHGSLASKRLENQVSQNFRDSVAKEQSLFYNVSFRAKQQSLTAEVPRKFATLHASPGVVKPARLHFARTARALRDATRV